LPEEYPRVKDILKIPINHIDLDKNNFRFSKDMSKSSQKEVLEELDKNYNLIPLARSMVDNGYFVEEPLVILQIEISKFIIIEGNRRLAALKFLHSKELINNSPNKMEWRKQYNKLRDDLKEIPCIVKTEDKEAYRVMGYRHITGTLKWKPLPKARFISDLVKTEGDNANFDEISEKFGISKTTIRDYYIAYNIYSQAFKEEMDTSELEKYFAVFIRSLNSTGILEFLGVNKNKKPYELIHPISSKKYVQLEDLISFLVGTKSEGKVINESRDITKLGMILSNKQAYNHLKITRRLDEAYAITGNIEEDLLSSINKANTNLGLILQDIHDYKDNEDIIKNIERLATKLNQILKLFPSIKQKIE